VEHGCGDGHVWKYVHHLFTTVPLIFFFNPVFLISHPFFFYITLYFLLVRLCHPVIYTVHVHSYSVSHRDYVQCGSFKVEYCCSDNFALEYVHCISTPLFCFCVHICCSFCAAVFVHTISPISFLLHVYPIKIFLRPAFKKAYKFNADLSKWDTAAVTDMFNSTSTPPLLHSDSGFLYLIPFFFFFSLICFLPGQPITTTRGMAYPYYTAFTQASVFNTDISKWNTAKARNMQESRFNFTLFSVSFIHVSGFLIFSSLSYVLFFLSFFFYFW